MDDMKRAKNDVALVLPYFGRLPSCFNHYLKSLEGKRLDVLLVTDLEIGPHPSNLHVVKMDMAALQKLAEKKLGVRVILQTPVRLCDLKPMYGHIFEDYLREYAYWAFGDCDLVYGNAIDDYIERILSGRYDAASCRRYWISGAFFMMKNTEKMRLFYRECGNWREVCASTSDTYMHFDEIGGRNYFDLQYGAIRLEEEQTPPDCLGAALWRASSISLFHEEVACETVLYDAPVSMSNGDLIYRDARIIFYHLVHAKRIKWFTWPMRPYDQIGDYVIDCGGIYPAGMPALNRRFIRICRAARFFMGAACRKLARLPARGLCILPGHRKKG